MHNQCSLYKGSTVSKGGKMFDRIKNNSCFKIKSVFFLMLFLYVVFPYFSPAQCLNKNQLVDISRERAKEHLFKGYNKVTGKSLAQAVEGSVVEDGGEDTAKVDIWVGEKRIKNAMQLNGSFELGVGGLFGFSVDAGMKQSEDISAYGVTIAVIVDRPQLKMDVNTVKLKSGIKAPVTADEMNNFVREHGDCYTSKVVVGGRYWATFTFNANSKTEQQEIQTKLAANGIIKIVTIDVEFGAKLSNFASENNLHLISKYGMSGISGAGPESNIDPTALVKFAVDFKKMPLNNPTVINREVLGYEHVMGFGAFNPVASNRDSFFETDGWAQKALNTAKCHDQLKWIQRVYDFYGLNTKSFDPEIIRKVKLNKKDIKKLAKVYQQYEKTPAKPLAPVDSLKLESIQDGIPALRYYVSDLGRVESKGGVYFNDLEYPLQRIDSIRVWAGNKFVDKIEVAYKRLLYDESEPVPGSVKTHGTDAGNTPRGPLVLDNDNYLNNITARTGSAVDFIKFVPAIGQPIEGGGPGGGLSEWNASKTTRIVAFSGRSGSWLDMIRLHEYEFMPAKWPGNF
jgi:hypothetical protein